MSARSFTLNKRRQGNITVERTMVEGEGEHVQVILHNTAVVQKMPDGRVFLSTGGWRTVTTKTAVNRALMLLGVDAHVVQQKGEWFLFVNGEKLAWENREFMIPTKLEQYLSF